MAACFKGIDVAFDVDFEESCGYYVVVVSRDGELDVATVLPEGWYTLNWFTAEGARGYRCSIFSRD